jgi:Calreticulin family
MKLLQDNKKLHQEEFSNASPYVIMFGPDKCGATNKVCIGIWEFYMADADMSRSTSSSATRTRRPASMRRST